MRQLLPIVLTAALLAGCDRGGSEPIVLVPCRPAELREYSAADQMRAAEELTRHLPHGSITMQMIEDYGELRVRLRPVRVCW